MRRCDRKGAAAGTFQGHTTGMRLRKLKGTNRPPNSTKVLHGNYARPVVFNLGYQNTFFIVTAVKTSNLTVYILKAVMIVNVILWVTKSYSLKGGKRHTVVAHDTVTMKA
jgi:hypothetical protein